MAKLAKILTVCCIIYVLIFTFMELSKTHYKHNHSNMCEGSGALAKR